MLKSDSLIPDEQKHNFAWTLLCISLLLIIGSIIYSNTLHSPFVFDDDVFILNDKNIRMTELTVESLADAAFKGRPRHRLLPNISFAVNYYLGQYQEFGYHILNIIIHLLTGVLLFLFIKATLKTETWRTGKPDYPLIVPFFAAMIWLVHPVNTQAVTYICQRMTSLVAMFYILSILFYVYGRIYLRSGLSLGLNPGLRANPHHYTKAFLLFSGCFLSGVCAVASKENAGVLPLFIILYEWFFFQDLKPVRTNKKLFLIICGLILFGIITILYLGENPVDRILRSYSYRDFTLPQRVLTEFRVVIYYISLFLFSFPKRMNLEHDYPLSLSLMDQGTTILSLVAITTLICFAICFAKKNRLMAFCTIWFFGNLLIESSVIGIEIIFEHRTYLPFMMVSLLFTLIISRHIKARWMGIGILCATTAIFAMWTFQRNVTWQNGIIFFTDCVIKSPNKFRPHNNLGVALYDANQFQSAIDHYKKALQVDPGSRYAEDTIFNIGSAELKSNNVQKAIPYFFRVLQLDPNHDQALNNLGNAFIHLKQYNKAIHYFSKVLEIDNQHVEAHTNIGVALTHLNRIDEAIDHYKTALELYPFHAETHNNLGVLLIHKNRLTQARHHFNKALQLNPDYMSAKNNLEKLMMIKKNKRGTSNAQHRMVN